MPSYSSISDSKVSPTASKERMRPTLLKSRSSFWPTNDEILARHPSFEILVPDHDCASRKSSPAIAIFNLVATVCGGGVLSLPLAFSRAGLIPSFLLMVFASVITDFAMYILCSCARRTGGRSYGDVMRKAFGSAAEIGSTTLLVFLLLFVIIAYMVLLKDIWTPILFYLVPKTKRFFEDGQYRHIGDNESDEQITSTASRYILIFLLIIVSPLVLKKDLHALRHTCYIGFGSALILACGLVHRAFERNVLVEPGLFLSDVKWVGNVEGILFAFPIVVLSFFSIYNVLSVHSSLFNPTRERVKFVLDGTITLCFSLFFVIGVCGYLFAYDDTRDNILLNFPLTYKTILAGRIGYGVTLLVGMPMVLVPCRDALFSLYAQVHSVIDDNLLYQEADNQIAMSTVEGETNKQTFVNGINFDDETPLLYGKQGGVVSYLQDSSSTTVGETTNAFGMSIDEADDDFSEERSGNRSSITLAHVLCTVAILFGCYLVAVCVPGVAVVWSIVGSSMAIIIGFTVPAACYLKIRSRKGMNPRSAASWFLLIFSIFASSLCTTRTIIGITLT